MKLAPAATAAQPEPAPLSGQGATARMLAWHRQMRETPEQQEARRAFVAACAARGIVADPIAPAAR